MPRRSSERPLYVALANTIIGVVMIGLALLGVVAELAGVAAAVGAVLGLSLLGVAATRWVPEPQGHDAHDTMTQPVDQPPRAPVASASTRRVEPGPLRVRASALRPAGRTPTRSPGVRGRRRLRDAWRSGARR